MSTIKTTNITHGSNSGTANLILDSSGNVSFSGALDENVVTITDGASVALNPANGSIQKWTLGANRTATESFTEGQSMLLMVADGNYFCNCLSAI